MNQKELMTHRNNVARRFEQNSRIHRNCIRLNVGNTFDHEQAKIIICMALALEKKEFITEAVTLDRKERYDIINLDDDERIEIETDPKRAERFEGRKDIALIELYADNDLEKIANRFSDKIGARAFVKGVPMVEEITTKQ